MAILAQIHKLIRTSYFAENASALSRILFKDNELKKMGRMDNFIKVNPYIINPATLAKHSRVFNCDLICRFAKLESISVAFSSPHTVSDSPVYLQTRGKFLSQVCVITGGVSSSKFGARI